MAWDDTKAGTEIISSDDYNDLVIALKAVGGGYQGYTGLPGWTGSGGVGATGLQGSTGVGLQGATGPGGGDPGWTGLQGWTGSAGAGDPWYNVVDDYSATGDGSTDDRTALNNANTAAATNGGVIYFPNGANNTFRVSSNLTFSSNVSLLFDEGTSLLIDAGVTVTINGKIDPSAQHQIFDQTEKITGTTIAFVAGSPDTITDSGSGFVSAGFANGDEIQVYGSESNDGTYTIATAAAGTLTLTGSGDLTDESAGNNVTITGSGTVALGAGSCQLADCRWFGCVGDNSTDNHYQIEKAIWVAQDVGALYFPAGVYQHAMPIDTFPYSYAGVLTGSMRFQGAGDTATIWKYTGTDGFGVKLWHRDLDSAYNAQTVNDIIFKDFQITAPNVTEKDGYIGAATLAFVASDPATITDSGSGFLTGGFRPGQWIRVVSSTNNNGMYRIATVTDGTITLEDRFTLTAESGSTYYIYTQNDCGALWLPGSRFCRFDNFKIGSVGNNYVGTAIRADQRPLITTEDNYNDTNVNAFATSDSGSPNEAFAFSFIPPSGDGDFLLSITAKLGKQGSPAGFFYAELYTDSSGPDTKLGVSSFSYACDAANASGAEFLIEFPWDSEHTITGNGTTKYWIVIRTTGYTYSSGVTEFRIYNDTGAGAANSWGSYNGSSWTINSYGANWIRVNGKMHSNLNKFQDLFIQGSQKPVVGVYTNQLSQMEINQIQAQAVGDCMLIGPGTFITVNEGEIDSNNTGHPVNCFDEESLWSNSVTDWNVWFEGGDNDDQGLMFHKGRHHNIKGNNACALNWTQDTPLEFQGIDRILSMSDATPFNFSLFRMFGAHHPDVELYSSGVATGTDSDAKDGEAIEIDGYPGGFYVWWKNENQLTLPRGTYVIKIYAKDTNQVANNLKVEYAHYLSGSPASVNPVTTFTLTNEYKEYTVHFDMRATDVTPWYGSRISLWKNADISNTISVSHVSIEYLGADHNSYNLASMAHELSDADGARESRHVFIGRRADEKQMHLAALVASHDGSGSDDAGQLECFVNDGNDSGSPTISGWRVESDGGIHMPNMKSGTTQVGAGAAAGELWYNTSTNAIYMGV